MARVLVIEDDDQMRRMVCDVLTRAGYDTVAAENGLTGVASFRETPADLVITDIFMPEMDGVETIREILADCARVKIIAMSGRGRGLDYPRSALLLGAWRALDKPFAPDVLLNAVSDALEETGGSETSE